MDARGENIFCCCWKTSLNGKVIILQSFRDCVSSTLININISFIIIIIILLLSAATLHLFLLLSYTQTGTSGRWDWVSVICFTLSTDLVWFAARSDPLALQWYASDLWHFLAAVGRLICDSLSPSCYTRRTERGWALACGVVSRSNCHHFFSPRVKDDAGW